MVCCGSSLCGMFQLWCVCVCVCVCVGVHCNSCSCVAGKVLYLNSPDTPINCVHRLRTLASANSLGVQTGHYTLTGDKV